MAETVKNWSKLKKKFDALKRDMQATMLENAVIAGALPIQNAAKSKVRVRSGTAKRSIHTEIIERSRTRILASIGTPKMSEGKNLSYTWFLEFKYPFLRPAFDAEKRNAVKEVQAALLDQLENAIS